MPDSITPKKTVAIIGAGPVGLAAAAHVLERGLEPVVLEAGPTVGHAVRQWSHVRMFSPWEYNIDKAADRLLTEAGWNRPQPDALSDRRRAGGAVSRAAGDAHAAQGPHPHQQPGDGDRPRRLRQGEDATAATPRRSRSVTRTARDRRVLRADAVIDATGTWFSPNPAGANGLPAIGEREAQDRIAYGMPDVLGRDRAALCRPQRRRAGRRPFGHRHPDRSREAEGAGAGHRDRLAAARRRRRRSRSAAARPTSSSARGALGTAFAALVASGKRHGSRAASGSATSRRDGDAAAHRRGLGAAAAATSRSTSWSSRPASGPTSTSCASCGCRSIRRSSARRRWRR